MISWIISVKKKNFFETEDQTQKILRNLDRTWIIWFSFLTKKQVQGKPVFISSNKKFVLIRVKRLLYARQRRPYSSWPHYFCFSVKAIITWPLFSINFTNCEKRLDWNQYILGNLSESLRAEGRKERSENSFEN